jgi:8-oxo-dGTP diphosphatase
MASDELFTVVITAIVVRDGKFLIMQRSPREEKFPSRWTVPGGKLHTADYIHFEKDTPHYWYNVLERTLKREVKEEAGIDIANIRYVTSLASADPGKAPLLVISCLADHVGGEVAFGDEMVDARWVLLEEARSHDLIEGIFEELRMADQMLKNEERGEWQEMA